MAKFSHVPNNRWCGQLKTRDRRPIKRKTPTISRKRFLIVLVGDASFELATPAV